MFTGIIAGAGKIESIRHAGSGVVFKVDTGFDLSDPEEGESIAVNGVCLTAYNILSRSFLADVSPETLSRSTLGSFTCGQQVNLERAVRLCDRLGGHLVSGHVDCTATVHSIREVGEYTIFHFILPMEQMRYVIEKGSIAIDGISLTVNSCQQNRFSVSIIPHTLKVTTLGLLRVGGSVNIEVDIIGKYVEKLLAPGTPQQGATATVTSHFLAENGFL